MKQLRAVIHSIYLNEHAFTRIQSVLVVAILVVAGSVGAFLWLPRDSVASTRVVWGTATLDGPLEGATVSIYDMDGEEVYGEKNVTGEDGSFIFELDPESLDRKDTPDDFIIVATGGMHNDEPFNGTLRSVVYHHVDGDYIVVNIVSTVIAAYMEEHPDETYSDAIAAVKTFLVVPSGIDLVNVSEYDDIYFNAHLFMVEAAGYGAFDTFIEHLLRDMDPGGTHAFHGVNDSVGGVFTKGFLKAGLKTIGNGILSNMLGRGVGWLMSDVLGIGGGPSPTQEKILKQIAQVNMRMDAVEGDLEDIQTGVQHLEQGQQKIMNRLDALTQQLESRLEALAKELEVEVSELQAYQEFSCLKSRRTTITTAIIPPVSDINTTFTKVYRLSQVNITAPHYQSYQNLSDKYVDGILDNDGIETQLETMHNNLVSFLGEKGLLEVWMEIATKAADNSSNITQIYQDFENRFSYLLGIELKGINLVVEAYHAQFGNDTQLAEAFWDDWNAKIEQQVTCFLRCVEQLMCTKIDTLTAQELNRFPAMAETSGSSSVLRRADAFASTVLDGFVSGIVSENETIGMKLKAPNGKYVYPAPDDKLAAYHTTLHAAETFEVTGVKGGVYMKATSNGKYVGWVDDELAAQFDTADANCTIGLVDLGNGSIGIRASDGKYVGLANGFHPRLIAEHQNLSQNETFEMFPESGDITIRMVNYPQFSGTSFDEMNISVTIDDDGTVFEADTMARSNGTTLSFYDAFFSKHDSVPYEILHAHFHVPFGTYHLGSVEREYPGLVRPADYNHTLTISSTDAFQAFSATAYLFNTQPAFSMKRGMEEPGAMDVDNDGTVYVVDVVFDNDTGDTIYLVKKFDGEGNPITNWSVSGVGEGRSKGIAVDDDAHVYITSMNNSVQKFTGDGTFITEWGRYGSGEGQFNYPMGTAVDGEGNVYVVDSWNNRVQKFTGDGTFITEWGRYGADEGQFNYPGDIAVDGEGNVYVEDVLNGRVQKFTGDGTFVTQWNATGCLAADRAGNIYVAGTNHRVQKFTGDGTFITRWGKNGSGAGEFASLSGIAVDGNTNVYVADDGNNRVQKFTYQKFPPSFMLVP
jgi:hypothetical protein